jgi:hypothetical protein
LRSHGRTVLLAAGTYLAISSLGYIVLVYFITYATRQLGLTLPFTLTLVMIASAICSPTWCSPRTGPTWWAASA